MDCLPVAIEIASPDLRTAVTRYVESNLGWQVVVDSAHYPAALILADQPQPGRPYVHIGDSTLDIAGALRAGAKDALIWPDEADRLASVAVKRSGIRTGRRLIISQAGPHVGASTLALALGAIYAWSGTKVALAAGPPVIRATGMPHPGRILACPNLWLIDPDAGPPDGFGMVIVEAPLGEKTQVLVGRPDRQLVRQARTHAQLRRIITVGDGELRPEEIRAAVGANRYGHLDWSHRIARAGLRGALPQSFPGRFLKQLAELVGQPVPGLTKRGQAALPPGAAGKGYRQSRMRVGQSSVSKPTVPPSRAVDSFTPDGATQSDRTAVVGGTR